MPEGESLSRKPGRHSRELMKRRVKVPCGEVKDSGVGEGTCEVLNSRTGNFERVPRFRLISSDSPSFPSTSTCRRAFPSRRREPPRVFGQPVLQLPGAGGPRGHEPDPAAQRHSGNAPGTLPRRGMGRASLPLRPPGHRSRTNPDGGAVPACHLENGERSRPHRASRRTPRPA